MRLFSKPKPVTLFDVHPGQAYHMAQSRRQIEHHRQLKRRKRSGPAGDLAKELLEGFLLASGAAQAVFGVLYVSVGGSDVETSSWAVSGLLWASGVFLCLLGCLIGFNWWRRR